MENLAFSLSSRPSGGSCDPLPHLICFTHENDFGPIPARASKPWDTARARTARSSAEHPEQSQPVGSCDALAAKCRLVDVSSHVVPAPPILLHQKKQRKNVSMKPRVKIDLVALANASNKRPASGAAAGRPALGRLTFRSSTRLRSSSVSGSDCTAHPAATGAGPPAPKRGDQISAIRVHP